MTKNSVVGVVLDDDIINYIGKAIEPYIQKGTVGSYIYCTKADYDYTFVTCTMTPEQTQNKIRDSLEISIPLRFVKMLVKAPSVSVLGFHSEEPEQKE